MSRLNPETNEWLCKIVLFTPPTETALDLGRQLLEALPEAECTLHRDPQQAGDATLVATYKPQTSTLADIQPIYAFHALRSTNSTAVDRQHLLGSVDGVVLLTDATNLEASNTAARELERFLGMYGKMISTLPVVVLATTTLSDEQQQNLNASDLSVFAAESDDALRRTVATLIDRLEQESGFAGISFDLDEIDEDSDSVDWDDVEFDDLHAYDDE